MKIINSFSLILVIIILVQAQSVEYGLAQNYPEDHGLKNEPAVIFFCGYENDNWLLDDYNYTGNLPAGYGITEDSALVFTGARAMEIQQTQGTHQPSEFHPKMPETDIAYVRWYRRWEAGYDWTQHKMPGVYARAPGVGGGGAGIPPNGYDKYSCKLYVDWDAQPRFYTYHPEQAGAYGDGLRQNIGERVTLEIERWYCFEMMIKANTVGQRDGELKMWIDGVLKGHYTDMRFRDTATLKINEFTHSAYVGGIWTSERDQKLWEDNLVVATEYLGPMVSSPSIHGPIKKHTHIPIQVYPNPFNHKTVLCVHLPGYSAPIHLFLFSISGQLIRDITLNGPQDRVHWDGRDYRNQTMPAGVYVLQLSVQDRSITQKMLKIK